MAIVGSVYFFPAHSGYDLSGGFPLLDCDENDYPRWELLACKAPHQAVVAAYEDLFNIEALNAFEDGHESRHKQVYLISFRSQPWTLAIYALQQRETAQIARQARHGAAISRVLSSKVISLLGLQINVYDDAQCTPFLEAAREDGERGFGMAYNSILSFVTKRRLFIPAMRIGSTPSHARLHLFDLQPDEVTAVSIVKLSREQWLGSSL